ncbi:MAG TPA: hypothetical protein VFX51_15090 [Solirubrobacteraceae bacterium]|nr:hypothetical protein [Solirubrobacteraceae bacterium]
MNGQPTAILMATESTRRNLTEPPREPRVRRPRRTVARVLAALAHRLDPAAVAGVGRTAAS